MSPPTRDEWQLVINSLPNGKAAGPSGVSNEMLKHLGKSMANALWKLICNCCQLNDIPADWREAVVYPRSEEHTSELQSRSDLVCRLLLEKKKKKEKE